VENYYFYYTVAVCISCHLKRTLFKNSVIFSHDVLVKRNYQITSSCPDDHVIDPFIRTPESMGQSLTYAYCVCDNS